MAAECGSGAARDIVSLCLHTSRPVGRTKKGIINIGLTFRPKLAQIFSDNTQGFLDFEYYSFSLLSYYIVVHFWCIVMWDENVSIPSSEME